MYWTREIRSAMGLLLLFAMVLETLLTGQSAGSCQLPIAGGDGASKNYKLSGSMGVIQLPRRPVKAPRTIRALLPRVAKVRLLQKLSFQPQDTLVVYDVLDSDRSNPIMDIRYPAVQVIRENHVVARVSLKRRTDGPPDWVFLEAGEIRLSPDLAGIALAFRSMGDGSVSLYLVLSPQGDKYHAVLNKITGEGRLRADQQGTIELWDANFGNECEWCDHRYTVVTYKWNGFRLAQVHKIATCRMIDPNPMTDKPIEAVQQSLDAEYAESERKRSQEQRFLRARLPAGLGGVYRGRLGRQEIFLVLGPAKAERWNTCDFRDPAEKRGRRYPIVGFYERDGGSERDIDSDVLLAGRPLSAGRIRLREYRDHKPTHNVWELSVTGFGIMGVRRILLPRGSRLLRNSTTISLKRLSHDFDPLFPTYEDGYDW